MADRRMSTKLREIYSRRYTIAELKSYIDDIRFNPEPKLKKPDINDYVKQFPAYQVRDGINYYLDILETKLELTNDKTDRRGIDVVDRLKGETPSTESAYSPPSIIYCDMCRKWFLIHGNSIYYHCMDCGGRDWCETCAHMSHASDPVSIVNHAGHRIKKYIYRQDPPDQTTAAPPPPPPPPPAI